MKSVKNQTLRILLYSVLSAGTAAIANAQYSSFTLPFEAHWGQAVLEPGNYKIAAPSAPQWPQILYLIGPHKTITVTAALERPEAISDRSFLKISNIDGINYVSKFQWGDRGKEFTFAKPSVREQRTLTGGVGGSIITVTRH